MVPPPLVGLSAPPPPPATTRYSTEETVKTDVTELEALLAADAPFALVAVTV
jgi:hypothetical protein